MTIAATKENLVHNIMVVDNRMGFPQDEKAKKEIIKVFKEESGDLRLMLAYYLLRVLNCKGKEALQLIEDFFNGDEEANMWLSGVTIPIRVSKLHETTVINAKRALRAYRVVRNADKSSTL